MSQNFPRPAGPSRGGGRRSRALVPTLIVLAVLAVAYLLVVNFWTERLWFDSVDFTRVFTTQLITRSSLFVVFGLLMAVSIVVNGVIAYRLRPSYRPMSVEQQSLDRYRDAIDPVRSWVLGAAALLVGIIAGASAGGEWTTFQLWLNGTEFGVEDPQFGTDLGFYAFSYPWWRYVVSFGFAIVTLGLIVAAITHYIYGGIRLQTAGEKVSPAAQGHLSLLIGLFILLKGVAYWLDRYAMLIDDNDLFTGGNYADINALLPAKTILIFVAGICAILFFVNVWRRSWMLPGIGAGLLVLSAVLLSGLWPFIVQQFQVNPTEADREAPYIERNIAATRDAYDIDGVDIQSYEAETTVEAGQLADDAGSIPGIRLMDPTVIPPAYQQLQQVRGFYTFAQPADVDRYEINGEVVDSVVAAREIDISGISSEQQNWVNQHTVYTHGFGMVAAYGNRSETDGSPDWIEEDIPSRGDLGDYEPRVYFGENSPEYSIVGAPEGEEPVEYDIPEDPETGGERRNTYDGNGGVSIGSFFNRVLYATKFQEANILLSDRVNSESQILYDRGPRQRVEKVAPWLTVDSNPFPTVVDGRLVWVIDAYTTLNSYPYSQRVSLEEATSDSRIARPALAAQPDDYINYARNSVKATVDAYDGTVTLYEWDNSDPVLQAWMDVFPESVTPRSEISDDLMNHLRYPEDMFKLQRRMLEQYHVTDPFTFYEGTDRWIVPNDPTSNLDIDQPPYYQSIQLPGSDEGVFSLTTTYTPRGRQNLIAFMTVNADARHEDYGQLTALRLPGDTQIDGPGQVANAFESNEEIASQLTLLGAGEGANVEFGNLLTLPVGGGLLYVQPVYVVRQAGDAVYPLLRRVMVRFGTEIGFDTSLQGALDDVFRGESGVETEEEGEIEDAEVPEPEGEGTDTEEPPESEQEPPADSEQSPPADEPDEEAPPADGTLEEAIADAQQAWEDAQAAQSEGRWADYGEALDRLEDALSRADQLSQGE
ncbi:UPF0182 family membrane protein [Phytoactinopolyspora halotolerans]|uniref:UPF0182 protein G1H10_28655 n=1 Tax=Phytoactinopolyspora halotolerans TaxID=1981512 RepID=A0A6L9SHM3_9ACTN|nr:UPF0182 family protein [Phytoactinopolyspora halotolerans]NEE04148.1 UPF0182 family protein [Phytoactinopolyspora halotolerans]